MRVTILGCGTSSGVPRIGGADGHGDWGLCDPANPKNRRRRVSILVEHEETTLLVDTGPDLREQLLGAGVAHLDGVFITHDHADHAHGIDDLRQVFHAMRRPVDVWASPETFSVIGKRFDYVFEGAAGYPASCTAHRLTGAITIGSIAITPFPQIHGDLESSGLRFDAGGRSLAYSTDVKAFDDRATAALTGLDLWVVDALRRAPHPTHSHLDATLAWIAHYQPEAALLTHMDQSMDHATLCAELPAHIRPAHDGLTIAL
ncbi:phosphoribosyl 1,2-cyclic phosphodiesterase [Polymorphobacter multimanifer]|uniref:Phosphoribosyl 1,2-cyclic phosphate phosphodiesterase n=1 Tax=Polymorphobacter multimanifer TaxID=1070431 RepID=A0A841LAJ1_9SPHN|nr:MBL fold metallo-hydrolase [Polymorphobacter multimanifer]MBB6226038.1 phosphoribosyl 1,2-cyclic phosphate phosphodiesterase [Polymorphobacter multimanifer]GGI79473.1 phosphoribosyl 1,2-cyclic phosphodiesterase [Polymorphobacter multimanifer]